MPPALLQVGVSAMKDTGAHRASQPDAATGLLATLEGLDSEALVQLCHDAAEMRCPLVQALASEKSRRLVVVQERASWRQSVTGALVHHFYIVIILQRSKAAVSLAILSAGSLHVSISLNTLHLRLDIDY